MVGDKSAEVMIYEDIGASFIGGLTARDFASELKGLGDIDHLSVRMNSMGGEVFEGYAIYNTLRDHSAEVTVHIDGLAASIASIIAMGGDRIEIAENGFMMIHEPLVMTYGYERDHLQQARMLAKLRDQAAEIYAKRPGMTTETANEIMMRNNGDGDWFNADEAYSYGLVDAITQPQKAVAMVVDRTRFPNAPSQFRDVRKVDLASKEIARAKAEERSRKLMVREKMLDLDLASR
jgi:ATP-dependent protease ClpP protease subunit